MRPIHRDTIAACLLLVAIYLCSAFGAGAYFAALQGQDIIAGGVDAVLSNLRSFINGF